MADKLSLSDLASLANETSAIAAINANNTLIEDAIDNTLSRDGSTPNAMEASLDMNENRILNLPEPISDQEPVRLIDIVDIDDAIQVVNGLSAYGVTLMTSADAAAARTTLGLLPAATTTIGTSGAVLSLLNTNNTHSGNNTYSGTANFTNTTDATNSTSGAIKTAGGMGIAKKLYVGTDLSIGGNTTNTGTLTQTGAVTIGAGNATTSPLTLTSGTIMTTISAGAFEYDGTTLTFGNATGDRSAISTPHWACLSANYSLTDTASAQKAFNSSTNGAITLVSSTLYGFEGQYLITNTGTNAHTWGVLFGGTATITSGSLVVHGRSGTTSAATLTADSSAYTTDITTVLVSTASSTSSTENVILNISGIVRINSGGTFIPQVKLSATTGGTITMLANSYFRIYPIGPSALAARGNWS